MINNFFIWIWTNFAVEVGKVISSWSKGSKFLNIRVIEYANVLFTSCGVCLSTNTLKAKSIDRVSEIYHPWKELWAIRLVKALKVHIWTWFHDSKMVFYYSSRLELSNLSNQNLISCKILCSPTFSIYLSCLFCEVER